MPLDLNWSDVCSWFEWAYTFGASLLEKCCPDPQYILLVTVSIFQAKMLRFIGGFTVDELQNPDVNTGICLGLCLSLPLFRTRVRSIWKGTLWEPVREAFECQTEEVGPWGDSLNTRWDTPTRIAPCVAGTATAERNTQRRLLNQNLWIPAQVFPL